MSWFLGNESVLFPSRSSWGVSHRLQGLFVDDSSRNSNVTNVGFMDDDRCKGFYLPKNKLSATHHFRIMHITTMMTGRTWFHDSTCNRFAMAGSSITSGGTAGWSQSSPSQPSSSDAPLESPRKMLGMDAVTLTARCGTWFLELLCLSNIACRRFHVQGVKSSSCFYKSMRASSPVSIVQMFQL